MTTPRKNEENYWWYITLRAPKGSEEVLASIAEASGSVGTEDIGRGSVAELQAYYRSNLDLGAWLERVSALLESWPTIAIHDMGRIENRPWNTEWMDAFPPLNVGYSLVVMAPWHSDSFTATDRTPLFIYPGSAFGTGYHESTQSVLTLLERALKTGDVVADIGCGSAILSIAALKLGASKAYARDLDPTVMEEAIHNTLELNGIDAQRLDIAVGDLLKGFRHKVDLLMANILLEPLCTMLPRVPSVLKKGGRAIFSGMLIAEGEEFKDLLEQNGLFLVDEVQIGDWCGLLVEKIG